jgi:lipopolysaccharide transport system permease protein
MNALPPAPAPRPAASPGFPAESRAMTGARLLLDARTGRRARLGFAWADLRDGMRLWRLAASLGWLDIRLRYRGSLLGPFWLTLSSAVMVASMGAVFSLLFHTSLQGYLPFLAVSLILWQAGIGAFAGEACTAFTGAEQTIRSVRMPFTVQVLRTIVRNLIVLAHNIVVPLAVFAIFGAWPGWEALLSLPGLLLWIVDGAAACFLLGCICARFRDIPPIVGSLMQIAYYITPVIWNPSQLGAKGWWLPLNPFFPLMEVVRAPLLGHVPGGLIWGAALGYSAVFCLVSALLFSRARARIAFWV